MVQEQGDGRPTHSTLGEGGPRVSRIALGTWHLGGAWGPVDEQAAAALIHAAVERGVNVLDSARAYGIGEAVLGQALRDDLRARREDFFVATKGGLYLGTNGIRRDSSPTSLRESLEESLRTIGVDYIDLYQLHWPDPDVEMQRVGEVFAAFKAEQKIRYVGVSNATSEELAAFATTCPIDAVQLPYSLLRRHIETNPMPYVAEHALGVLAYGSLAHGVLTDDFVDRGGFAPDDWRSTRAAFAQAGEAALPALRALRDLAGELGLSLAQLAVAWVLRPGAADVAIVGAHGASEIDDALTAAATTFEPALLAQIDALMDAVGEVRLVPVFDDGKQLPAILQASGRA